MYFCAFGLVAFAPIAYAICQVFTTVLYVGRWRWWSLIPIPIFLAGFVPLLYVQTPVAFVLAIIGAPALGLAALACVWGQYTSSARRAAEGATEDSAIESERRSEDG